MGGGGGTSGPIGDLSSLVERAKAELRAAQEQGRRNVFISFAYEDLSAVNLLRGQAKNANVPLEFNDWSVSEPFDSERATYIKQKISERIAQSSVTVVFLSDTTARSSWVDWEIAESLKQGKHVVGVYPRDSAPRALPVAFKTGALKCVAWSELATTIQGLD